MLNKKILLNSLFVIMSFFKLDAIEIHTNPFEKNILENFFRIGIIEENFSYVLSGDKPMAIRFVPSTDQVIVYHDLNFSERDFKISKLFHEIIPIWNKYLSNQNNFVYKTITDSSNNGIEVAFINIAILKKVVEENINLFRYALGPLTSSDQIIQKIAFTDESLTSILNACPILEGIVLGFGTHNSLMGGRADQLRCNKINEKMPYANKNLVLDNYNYFTNYLCMAGGSGKEDCFNFFKIKPSGNFKSLSEELIAIENKSEPFPECLNESPKYVCGAYKNETSSNQPFFDSLVKSQKNAQRLLASKNFIEEIFSNIYKENVALISDKSTNSLYDETRNLTTNESWINIICKKLETFNNNNKKLSFIDYLFNNEVPNSPVMIGACDEMLNGLNIAKENLNKSNQSFDNHNKDVSLISVVPGNLYIKTNIEGSGKDIKDFNRVRISFIISDINGKTLESADNYWINLHETIPGFAQGVLGMKMGEERTIYIHPSLGYGDFTSFPLCIELVAKVTLHEIDEKVVEKLLYPEKFNFEWLLEKKFYSDIDSSIKSQPPYAAYFYRTLLDKQTDIDKEFVLNEIRKRAELLRAKISPTAQNN